MHSSTSRWSTSPGASSWRGQAPVRAPPGKFLAAAAARFALVVVRPCHLWLEVAPLLVYGWYDGLSRVATITASRSIAPH